MADLILQRLDTGDIKMAFQVNNVVTIAVLTPVAALEAASGIFQLLSPEDLSPGVIDCLARLSAALLSIKYRDEEALTDDEAQLDARDKAIEAFARSVGIKLP